jgi:hypothetical protein
MIDSLNKLPKNEYNRRYGDEIIRKTIASSTYLRQTEFDWVSNNIEWVAFVSTVTFMNLKGYESYNSMEKATKYEYNKRVLNKIKKRLCRSISKWDYYLPIQYSQYEYEQGSFFKPIPKDNTPHHIHGLFAVRREVASRIYDFSLGKLDKRVSKDLRSISTVSTFKIEPLRVEETQNWLKYMSKGKVNLELF